MYCSNCGEKGSGNFCSACGARLDQASAEVIEVVPVDWRHEFRYERLLQVPEVRERIARESAGARKPVSGEQYLELFDSFASTGVPLKLVAELVAPLYARWGIGTGKGRSGVVPAPIGSVLVATLCSLVRHSRNVKQVRQGNDGCVLEASLPSDLFSFEGEVVISLTREASGTRVEAATKIPGQLYDWGKSNRCLNALFDDLRKAA